MTSESIDLFVRQNVKSLLSEISDAHPGLMLDKGLINSNKEEGTDTKSGLVRKICQTDAGAFYKNAYERWVQFLSQPRTNFKLIPMQLDGRLFIGNNSDSVLETGCMIHHTYGTPYIPGSSIKGVVRAYAQSLDGFPKEACDLLFGKSTDSSDDHAAEDSAGELLFYDAWWIPGSADKPLVDEIVTTHHSFYYSNQGKSPATDFDSPIPNSLIGVQGGFLFAVSARNPQWLDLGGEMLETTLKEHGVGARTRSGYGYFKNDEKLTESIEWQVRKIRKQAEQQDEQKAEEKKLKQALAGLPDDAAQLVAWREDTDWVADANRVIADLKNFMGKHVTLSPEAIGILRDMVDNRWKGILNNPHATLGKKERPKYNPGPVEIAERVISYGE